MFDHLSLRLRIFLLFALLALAGSALVIGGIVIGYMRLHEPGALSSFIIAGFVGVLAIIGLTTWVWVLFDENVARPVERLAAGLRARAHAGVEGEMEEHGARYLGDLGPAARAVTAHLTESRNALAMEIARETARLSRQKARLEALLSEAPTGVLFCTSDHSIVLYNARARDILGETPALGLDRPLSGVILPGPIEQAYARLLARDADGGRNGGADILCATARGKRLLEARMRLLRLEGQETERPGYVLSLSDVSRDLDVQAQRESLLSELLSGVERALPDISGPGAEVLSALACDIAERKAETDTEWWPMEALSPSDLGAALAARLSRKGIDLTPQLPEEPRLRCDGFAVTRLLERLALEWTSVGAEGFGLELRKEAQRSAQIVLTSAAPLPGRETLEAWLDTPLSPGLSRFSGRDVLASHGSRIDLEGGLCLSLRLAKAPPLPSPALVQYDFDLLNAAIPEELSAAALDRLSFAVFDTETTGLNPRVDEICQIAAVRVVNGRVLSEERLDLLVNPGRPIPAGSTAVHGIDDAMVAGAASVPEALSMFHVFARDSVLVAHNAPFDMNFLQRREADIGARFDQPVLDTVLLSAILFGQSAEHTLDALCDRLGITIPEEARHTAIGDAIATAEALNKMLPMLRAAGLETLGQTIAEFDKHKRLIEHLN